MPSDRSSRRIDIRRLYPALLFAPLFYWLVRVWPPPAFFAFVTLVSLLALWEFYRLSSQLKDHRMWMVLGGGCLAIFLAMVHGQTVDAFLLTAFFSVTLISLIGVMARPPVAKGFLLPVWAIPFGVIYLGSCLAHFLMIRMLPQGDLFVFFVVLVTWAGDTGAYFIGVSLGRHCLAPRLSPKKTVEGFLGGLALAILAALVIRAWFLPALSLVDSVVLGSLLTGMGLFGDLSESAFKRVSGVKDSGSMIPGHGGILDRIDSLLLSAPAFYYYLMLVHTRTGG